MALPVHVQSSGILGETGTNIVAIALTGVVTGNAILVGILQNSSTSRTYTVADAQGNTYLQKKRFAPGQVVEIWEAVTVTTTAGAVTVTVTGSGAAVVEAIAVEVAELGTTDAFNVAGELAATTATTHFSAPTGEIDTAANVYLLSLAVFGSTTTPTPGSGWTTLGAGPSNQAFAQYRISAGALTDERGTFTITPSRPCTASEASFKAPAAAGGILRQMLQHHG